MDRILCNLGLESLINFGEEYLIRERLGDLVVDFGTIF